MGNVNVAVSRCSFGGMDHNPLGQPVYPEIEVAVWPIIRVVGVEGDHNRNLLQSEPEKKWDDVLTIKSILEVYMNQINLGAHENRYFSSKKKGLSIRHFHPLDPGSLLNEW